MSDREKAIGMFMRKYGATSHHVREDGALILTLGSGKKMKQLIVTANRLDIVEERVRTNMTPYRYELEAVPLGVKARPKVYKQDPGKRLR